MIDIIMSDQFISEEENELDSVEIRCYVNIGIRLDRRYLNIKNN